MSGLDSTRANRDLGASPSEAVHGAHAVDAQEPSSASAPEEAAPVVYNRARLGASRQMQELALMARLIEAGGAPPPLAGQVSAASTRGERAAPATPGAADVRAWLDALEVPADPKAPISKKDGQLLAALASMSEDERGELLRALPQEKLDWLLRASEKTLGPGNAILGTAVRIFKEDVKAEKDRETVRDAEKVRDQARDLVAEGKRRTAGARKELEAGKIPRDEKAALQALREMSPEELSRLSEKLAGAGKLVEAVRIAAGSDDPKFKARFLGLLAKRLDGLTDVMRVQPGKLDLSGAQGYAARIVRDSAASARQALSDAMVGLLAHETDETIDQLRRQDRHGDALTSLFQALGEPDRTDEIVRVLVRLEVGAPAEGKGPTERIQEPGAAKRLGYVVGALQAGLEGSASDAAARSGLARGFIESFATIALEVADLVPFGDVVADPFFGSLRERMDELDADVRSGQKSLGDVLEDLAWPPDAPGDGAASADYEGECAYVLAQQERRRRAS